MNGAWSLRRTLLAIMLVLTMSVWAFSAVIVYLDADHESHELFDQSLAETAHLLLTLADHEVIERMAMSPQALAESDNQALAQYLKFQVWSNKGRMLYKNKGAPDTPFVTKGKPGFGWTTFNGQHWRTYVAWDKNQHLQIQVGEPASHRKEISGRFAYKLLLFALLVLPLMAAGIWWAVNRVFRALQESANQVSQRTPNDLHEVSLAGAPSEVHPLLHAINRLFERVSRTLEREQRFTADAAHELRTPLAAIKTNLQVIQRARNDAERAEFIIGLGVSVDRATRLVEQLMTLARLDPQYEANHALQKIDLSALLAARLPALRAQAAQQQLRFDATLEPAPCLVHPASFLILLRNLIDNALRYTPAGGRVHLSCQVQQQQVCLTIADSGPGIAFDMQTRVFERFFRLSDAGKSGSGLGLSIVKRIAEAHHATIELATGLDGAGLAVRISFPLCQPGALQRL